MLNFPFIGRWLNFSSYHYFSILLHCQTTHPLARSLLTKQKWRWLWLDVQNKKKRKILSLSFLFHRVMSQCITYRDAHGKQWEHSDKLTWWCLSALEIIAFSCTRLKQDCGCFRGSQHCHTLGNFEWDSTMYMQLNISKLSWSKMRIFYAVHFALTSNIFRDVLRRRW